MGDSLTLLKGNNLWAISYMISSLKNYPVRNMGIALVLAIGITLPTSVFIWTDSGTNIAVEEFFSENLYQLSVSPKSGQSYESSQMADALNAALGSPLVERADTIASTVGILQGQSIPEWAYYDMHATNYANRLKDMRVVLVTNELLAVWSSHIPHEGQFSLNLNEVLVSEQFVEYTKQVHNLTITVGSTIDFDLLPHPGADGVSGTPYSTGMVEYKGLLVVGTYRPKTTVDLLAQALPSISRKNWDPMSLYAEPVLGQADSIMMLEERAGQAVVTDVRNRGFFSPVGLIRASTSGLMAHGAANIGKVLESLKTQLELNYSRINIKGLVFVWQLVDHVNTFLQSQILTIVVFPVLVMSLMLTVFTSETSVSRRKGEISALRSKGASFNQVFATFMWESVFLALLGLLLGVGLAILFAPLIGSSVGFLVFDLGLYALYVSHLSIPPIALVIASVIAVCLPGAYLLHVARRIDVSEVGQPTEETVDAATEAGTLSRYSLGLGCILVLLIVLPSVLNPVGPAAIGEILLATILLFVASYVGSRAMRLVTARISSGTSFLLGEKSLYMSQSLRKRKGQFIPLMVILTLTLTTTSMMLVQASSFESTVLSELGYAIGADARVESTGYSIYYNDSLMQFPGVFRITPVIETWAMVGSNTFNLEGVDAHLYSRIGVFSASSFVSGTPTEVLTELAETPQGIVISSHYSRLWDKSVGDVITVSYGSPLGTVTRPFTVVGVMNSAPGFGLAYTGDAAGVTFASQFGFQVDNEGFALVNLDLLYEEGHLEEPKFFLVDSVANSDISQFVSTVGQMRGLKVYTIETYDLASQSYSVRLFLSGIQGLTAVSLVLCASMGLASITLFLGSAVIERKQEYALFRSLGATKSQVVSMVFGEFAGSVVAAIGVSVFLGAVFGYVMSLLTFGISPFFPIVGTTLTFPVSVMAGVLMLESIALLGSTLIPAMRASSVDPAVVLRNL
ncbi:MAG: ABC transporter permease [Candidatus Thorarchaeota archaeon]|nr:ABC transporter permease [Candidatus Thorarchaeota archaeon]